MTAQDVKQQEYRIEQYHALTKRITQLEETLRVMAAPLHECTDSCFTGNIRESRRVTRMDVTFSATLGMQPGGTIAYCNLDIPAGQLGDLLAQNVRGELKIRQDELQKL